MSVSTGQPLGTNGEQQYLASFSYLLETAGKQGKRINVSEKDVALASAEIDEEARLLAHRVASRYIDALADQQKLDNLADLIQISKELLQLVEARVLEGDAAAIESKLLTVEVTRSETQRLAVAGRLAVAVTELKTLAGLSDSERFSLIDPSPLPENLTLNTLLQQAHNQRGDLKAARALADQAEAELQLAKAQGKPDLTVSLTYSRQYGEFDDLSGMNSAGMLVPLKDRDDTLAFGLAIPLGTGRRNRGNLDVANSRLRAASLRSEYQEAVTTLEVENAWNRVQNARQAVETYEQSILLQLDQNLDTIREAYQLGQLRLLDVLNEQRRTAEVRLEYIDAKAELNHATAELEQAVGGSLR
jgi:cobalt-zinc-cadmium efflux system outer membrane protein